MSFGQCHLFLGVFESSDGTSPENLNDLYRDPQPGLFQPSSRLMRICQKNAGASLLCQMNAKVDAVDPQLDVALKKLGSCARAEDERTNARKICALDKPSRRSTGEIDWLHTVKQDF